MAESGDEGEVVVHDTEVSIIHYTLVYTIHYHTIEYSLYITIS